MNVYANCNNKMLFENDPCDFGTVVGGDRTHVNACTELRSFDYFTGSAAPYIVTFTAVGVFALSKLPYCVTTLQ